MLFLQQKKENMEKKFLALKSCPLFKGIAEKNVDSLLECLSANIMSFEKNDFVFMAGDKVASIGIVLDGGVNIIQEDFWGNRSILAHIGKGQLFGEAFSCAQTEKLPVSVIVTEKSEIMLIDYRKIITSCLSSCMFHTLLINNMIQILAAKNIMLSQKIRHITNRSTREKLLSFFSDQAKLAGKSTFAIPFDRQGLADYLAVERSAMSNELSKLRDEGLIKYKKNLFELINKI